MSSVRKPWEPSPQRGETCGESDWGTGVLWSLWQGDVCIGHVTSLSPCPRREGLALGIQSFAGGCCAPSGCQSSGYLFLCGCQRSCSNTPRSAAEPPAAAEAGAQLVSTGCRASSCCADTASACSLCAACCQQLRGAPRRKGGGKQLVRAGAKRKSLSAKAIAE